MKLHAFFSQCVVFLATFFLLLSCFKPGAAMAAVTMQTDDEVKLSTGTGEQPTTIESGKNGHSMRITHPQHMDNTGTINHFTITPEIYWDYGRWNYDGQVHPPKPPHRPKDPDHRHPRPDQSRPDYSRPDQSRPNHPGQKRLSPSQPRPGGEHSGRPAAPVPPTHKGAPSRSVPATP